MCRRSASLPGGRLASELCGVNLRATLLSARASFGWANSVASGKAEPKGTISGSLQACSTSKIKALMSTCSLSNSFSPREGWGSGCGRAAT